MPCCLSDDRPKANILQKSMTAERTGKPSSLTFAFLDFRRTTSLFSRMDRMERMERMERVEGRWQRMAYSRGMTAHTRVRCVFHVKQKCPLPLYC
ncbi:hypothetical protein BA896_008220 [Janthinobacterium lividum]|uniref:Uncharacterized protein n=1 Tax=Janthinobacterium lividum TaxID=29581 RepID=A0A1E8PTF7_9BURK|nr:hypothetical protein BA896_008220 [Janthinobacterium lividum]